MVPNAKPLFTDNSNNFVSDSSPSLIGINETFRSCGEGIRQCCSKLFCICPSCDFNSSPLGHNSLARSTTVSSSAQSSWIRLVTLIWLCSALLSIPHSLYNQVVVYPGLIEGFEMVRCAAVFPSEETRFWLTILTPTSQYLLPIGLTGLFYARIGYFLWRRTDPVGVVSEGRRLSILRRKRKRVKMLVVVVSVFAICWLPLHLYVTLIDFRIIQHHFGIFFVTHWIAMSSVCYNPFIYCWLNETFRRKTNSLFSVFVPMKNGCQRIISFSCCLYGKQCPVHQTSEKANVTRSDNCLSIEKNCDNETSDCSRNSNFHHQLSGSRQTESCKILITQDPTTNYEETEGSF